MVLTARLHSIPIAALTRRHSRSSSTWRRLHVVSNAVNLADSGAGAAVVWYKNDLRLDDHPGLVAAASQHQTVVPLYVFDSRMISGLSDEMLEALLIALEDLKKLLKNQGSDLFVGFGYSEDVIMKIVNDVKATQVFAEEDVDYINHRVINIVESNLLAASFPWGSPKFVSWKAPLYDLKNMKELPALYNTFKKLKLPVSNPIMPPTLPIINMGLERGDLPTLNDVKMYLNDESWRCIKRISAIFTLQKKLLNENPDIVLEGSSTEKLGHEVRLTESVFASQNGYEVKGGTEVALNGLAAYLRYLEGTGRDDWQDIHEKMRMTEHRNGASFSALFGVSIYFGTISRRRVHYEAIKYEKERNAGFLSPFGYSTPTVAAAVESVCSMEWYRLLSLKSQFYNEGACSARIWRWRGFLIQYTVAGDDGPPILFVHGFGAFLEHFRENIYAMAKSGHRVWGVTLLGFGRSEKPNVFYSELMWAELLRDFIVDIVKEPVHLVGNSIGGYFVASAAGLWPALAKSLVLINTAGKVDPDYLPVPLTELRETSGVAWFGSRLLLLYLRFMASDILKKCYPTNPDRADDWLVSEILRASYDPGVTIVLESVFNFKLPVPLNYLLESFGEKVLVIQGMRDPLSKSKERLSMFRKCCKMAIIKELDAGHCPHDECPEEVNLILTEWIQAAESTTQNS